jgi:hypothetical protein
VKIVYLLLGNMKTEGFLREVCNKNDLEKLWKNEKGNVRIHLETESWCQLK